jgi:hypothetical protein
MRARSLVLLAVVWILSFSFCLQAQQVPCGPAVEDSKPIASAELAPAPAALPTPPALPSDPAAALPPEPPDSGGMMGWFREDLTNPLKPSQKFARAMKLAVFPGIVATAGAAGIGMAKDTRLDRDFGMGAEGFARRWGSAFGQNAVGLFVGDFALASAFHQDPRYHPDAKKGFGHRLGHALAALVVTRSDSGQSEFNSSHLMGIAAGAGVATAWHPPSDRNGRFFAERFGYDLAGSAVYRVIAEFIFYKNEPRR